MAITVNDADAVLPIPAKEVTNSHFATETKAKAGALVEGLSMDQFIGFFASEAALGEYLVQHLHPRQADVAEHRRSRLADPAGYARMQVTNEVVVIIYDTHGLWAFNAAED